MSFNQYTWDLYKQTTIGIEMINTFPMREDMFYSRIIVRTLISYQKIYITIGWRIYIATVYQIMTIPAHWKKQKIYTFHLSH